MPLPLSGDAVAVVDRMKELAPQWPHHVILLAGDASHTVNRGQFFEPFEGEWDCSRLKRTIQELIDANVLRMSTYTLGMMLGERSEIWLINDPAPVNSIPPRCGSEYSMSEKTSQGLCEPSKALHRWLVSIYPDRLQICSANGVYIDGQGPLKELVTEEMGCECPPDSELWPWFRGLITTLEDAGYAELEDRNPSNRIMGYLRAVGRSHAEKPAEPDECGYVASLSGPRSEADLITAGQDHNPSAAGNLPAPPEITKAPTYNVAALRDMTGLSNTTLNHYGKTANVKTARRGQRNWRFPVADVRAVLETIIARTSEDALRKKCSNALQALPEAPDNRRTIAK